MEAKGKASLWLYTTTQMKDQHYFRGFWPVHTTIAKADIVSSFIKDPKFEKLKMRTQEVTTF